MKKNILIFTAIIIVIFTCIALIIFFKPSESPNTSKISSNDQSIPEESQGVETVMTEPDGDILYSEETLDTKEEERTDFNEVVYGKDTAQDTEHTNYSNTKSDMSIQPVDPESDPANELVDNTAVNP